MNKIFFTLLLLLAGTTQSQVLAQKIYYLSDLDNIRGLFIIPGDKEAYTGLAVEEHPNRKRSAEVPIKAGQIEGTVKEWNIEGVLTSETKYEKGLKNGLEKQWYDNGKKKLEVYNLNGLAEGKCLEWHPNGKQKSEGNYKAGKEDGLHVWWFDNDKKDQQATYQNGLLEGTFQNWHRNGQLRLEVNYKAGKKQGSTTEWFETGIRKMEGNYENDQLQGKVKSYSKTAHLMGIQTFNQGKLTEDINYRSGSIELSNGFLEIFNEPELAITVALTGTYVVPKKAEVPTYNLEGKVVQLFITAVDSIHSGLVGTAAILDAHLKFEQAFIEKSLKTKINPTTSVGKTAKGRIYQSWSFLTPQTEAEPAKNARKVVQEHYLSSVCGAYVLSIYCPSVSLDKPEETTALMQKIAETITEHPALLDISKLAREIKQTMTWPGK